MNARGAPKIVMETGGNWILQYKVLWVRKSDPVFCHLFAAIMYFTYVTKMASSSAVCVRNITTKALQFRSAVALAKVREELYKDKVKGFCYWCYCEN